MVKEGADQHPVVLFTKENMGSDKPVTVVNIPNVRFIGGPSKQGRTGKNKGTWNPDRSVAVVSVMYVLVGEALLGFGMNSRRSVIHL